MFVFKNLKSICALLVTFLCSAVTCDFFLQTSIDCLFSFTNQKHYDIDDAAMNWLMATCGRKWKEFKAHLKRQFFDETLTDAKS